MLTTEPYLRIRRPSPTTAEFIVSTLPPPTLPLRLILGTIYLLRLLLALAILLMIYASQTSYYATTHLQALSSTETAVAHTRPDPIQATTVSNPVDILAKTPILSLDFVQQVLNVLLYSRPGFYLSRLAYSAPPWALIPCSLATLYVLSLRIGAEERLLVLRGLGVQTSSSGATVFSALKTRFIPTDKIQDILINEAFQDFQVLHYLIVLVEGEERIVVVFPRLLPRPRVLEKVWKGARECLYGRDGEDKKEGKKGKGGGMATI
ncbi:GPI-GlcNAc transferase complex, PIG-H component-domain-containing protein [Daldinia sp. FL1419]|nr:GPI-GlcNAc transferase complex, PIG-H component-domain-containing protein [Daldinia sp. FL1419]